MATTRAIKTGRTRTWTGEIVFDMTAKLGDYSTDSEVNKVNKSNGCGGAVRGFDGIAAFGGTSGFSIQCDYYEFYKSRDVPGGSIWASTIGGGGFLLTGDDPTVDHPDTGYYAPPSWLYGYSGIVTSISLGTGWGTGSSVTYATDDGSTCDISNFGSYDFSVVSKGSSSGTYTVTAATEEWIILYEDGSVYPPYCWAQYVEAFSGSKSATVTCGSSYITATTTAVAAPTEDSILAGGYFNPAPWTLDIAGWEVKLVLGTNIGGCSISGSINGTAADIPTHYAQTEASLYPQYKEICYLTFHNGGMETTPGTFTGAPYLPFPGSGDIPAAGVMHFSSATVIDVNAHGLNLDAPATHNISLQFTTGSLGPDFTNLFVIRAATEATKTISREQYCTGCSYVNSYPAYPGQPYPLSNSLLKVQSLDYTIDPNGAGVGTGLAMVAPSYEAMSIGGLPDANVGDASYSLSSTTTHVMSGLGQSGEGYRWLKIPVTPPAAGLIVTVSITETCAGAANETNQVKTYRVSTTGTTAETLTVDLCAPNVLPGLHSGFIGVGRQQSRYPTGVDTDIPFWSDAFWGVNLIESITVSIAADTGTYSFGQAYLTSNAYKVDCGALQSNYKYAAWNHAYDGVVTLSGEYQFAPIFVRGDMRWGLEVSYGAAGSAVKTLSDAVTQALAYGYSSAVVSSTDTSSWYYSSILGYVSPFYWDDAGPQSQLNLDASTMLRGQIKASRISYYPRSDWAPRITNHPNAGKIEGIVYMLSRKPWASLPLTFAPSGATATTASDGQYQEGHPYETWFPSFGGIKTISSPGIKTVSVDFAIYTAPLSRIIIYEPGAISVDAMADPFGQYHDSVVMGDGSVIHSRSNTNAPISLSQFVILPTDITQASITPHHGDGRPVRYTYVKGNAAYVADSHDDGETLFDGSSISGSDHVAHTQTLTLHTQDCQLVAYTAYVSGTTGACYIKVVRLNADGTQSGPFVVSSGSPIQFVDGQFGLMNDAGTGNPLLVAILNGDTAPSRYVSYDDGETWTSYGTIAGATDTMAFQQETPSGTVDGSNVTFTLTHTPITNSLVLYQGTKVLIPGSDYTLSAGTITMAAAPETNSQGTDQLYATYSYTI